MSECRADLIYDEHAVRAALPSTDSRQLSDFLGDEYSRYNSGSEIRSLLDNATTHLHKTEYGIFALSQVVAVTPPFDVTKPVESNNDIHYASAMRRGVAMMLDAMVELELLQSITLQGWAEKRRRDTLDDMQVKKRKPYIIALQATSGYVAFDSALGKEVTRVGIAAAEGDDKKVEWFCNGAGLVMHHIVEADFLRFEQQIDKLNPHSIVWGQLLQEPN